MLEQHKSRSTSMTLLWLYFSLQGRISRKQYWMFYLIPTGVIGFVIGFMAESHWSSDTKSLVEWVILLVFAWPTVAVGVKRYHDINKSGWWIFINLIPIIGSLWHFIQTAFFRSTQGNNRFGPSPLRMNVGRRNNMKKALMILGGIFAVLIIAGVIGVAIMVTKGNTLDEESKAYVDQVAPIILADLNKETLFKYASDELKNSSSPEDFDKIFNWFTKLGRFKKYKGSTGQSITSLIRKGGKQSTGLYEAHAEFETGPATIIITVIKKGHEWQVLDLGFHINSMGLPTKLP